MSASGDRERSGFERESLETKEELTSVGDGAVNEEANIPISTVDKVLAFLFSRRGS